jgi:hypothetical protein
MLRKLVGVAFCLCTLHASAFGAPVIFFSDLESGPKIGGENGNGAWVTIYGRGFGTTQGASFVTIGGGNAAGYKSWGTQYLWYQKISFQLGVSAQTGNIVVNVGGQLSNGIPFTVRPGNIYFVSPVGNDVNPGTVDQPFVSLTHTRDVMQPGDIGYVRQGFWNQIDAYGSVLNIFPENTGVVGSPKALVAYPGESAWIGDSTIQYAISILGHEGSSTPVEYWIIAGLILRASDTAVRYVSQNGQTNHTRIVGNDVRQFTVSGDGISADGDGTDYKILGNDVHDNGNGIDKSYSVYWGGMGTQSALEIGWNDLHDNPRGKGIQIYGHFNGDSISNVRIHDNRVYNNTESGMVLGGSDGTPGFLSDVSVYNNLIYNNGAGDPLYSYYGIQAQNWGLSGPAPGTGNFTFYNNTFYNNGDPARHGGATLLADDSIGSLLLKNNIVVANPATLGYFDWGGVSPQSKVSGTNNLWYGDGPGPSQLANNVNADPLFVNAVGLNFHLQSSSLAVDAGIAIPVLLTDVEGVSRPQGAAFDMGAYEFIQTNQTPPSILSSATANPNPALAGQTVAFSVAAIDPDGDVLTYAWTFGDGGTAVGASASYTYTTAGTYTTNVTIFDGNGNSVSSSVTVTVNALPTYTIAASAYTGGTITPSGAVIVNSSASQTFTIAPSSGYTISGVTVDGASVGAVSTYKFTNVTANHAIAASFNAVPPPKTVYVAAIAMSLSTTTKGKAAIATVTIKDNNGVAVGSATVSGTWSGLTSANVSGNIGSAGTAKFTSARTRKTGTFTFTATNVSKSGFTYASNQNVINTASITTTGTVSSIVLPNGTTNVVDLGNVKAGQSLKLVLPLPAGLNGSTRFKSKATGVPKGVRVGGDFIGGKIKSAGTFTFTVSFTQKVGGTSVHVSQQYAITVTP